MFLKWCFLQAQRFLWHTFYSIVAEEGQIWLFAMGKPFGVWKSCCFKDQIYTSCLMGVWKASFRYFLAARKMPPLLPPTVARWTLATRETRWGVVTSYNVVASVLVEASRLVCPQNWHHHTIGNHSSLWWFFVFFNHSDVQIPRALWSHFQLQARTGIMSCHVIQLHS